MTQTTRFGALSLESLISPRVEAQPILSPGANKDDSDLWNRSADRHKGSPRKEPRSDLLSTNPKSWLGLPETDKLAMKSAPAPVATMESTVDCARNGCYFYMQRPANAKMADESLLIDAIHDYGESNKMDFKTASLASHDRKGWLLEFKTPDAAEEMLARSPIFEVSKMKFSVELYPSGSTKMLFLSNTKVFSEEEVAADRARKASETEIQGKGLERTQQDLEVCHQVLNQKGEV